MKLATLALGTALFALPALAKTTTVEYKSDAGTTTVVDYVDDGTATANGMPLTYTLDEATKTLCADVSGYELCVTFEELGTAVGDTSKYTSTMGDGGVATITAIAE
ncbi:MAG: hypothetical protein ACRBEQ_13565 [Hyphomonas sp.]